MKTNFLLLLMMVFMVQPLTAQKGKLKKGVYTSPGKEFQIDFSYLLGKPKLKEELKNKQLVSLAISDDECRTFSLELHGETDLSAEDWELQSPVMQEFKKNLPPGSKTTEIETVYGKAKVYQFSLPGMAPCAVITGEDGKWVQHKPDAKVGLTILKINGSIYCFSYLISEEPFDLWGQGLDNIDKELTKYINGFKLLKPRKAI
ncbi:hypothetical protein [Salinimicrobium flavum]|uniref:Uncharacterized protein n=1 Tax=Salinimicrobium flavum TaxID=1737065 RepID=A0ABW5IZH5_9FLAO